LILWALLFGSVMTRDVLSTSSRFDNRFSELLLHVSRLCESARRLEYYYVNLGAKRPNTWLQAVEAYDSATPDSPRLKIRRPCKIEKVDLFFILTGCGCFGA